MDFHSILFLKLLVLSLKSRWQTLWKASKAFLFTTKHECHLTMYRQLREFDFYACLTKNKSSSELRKQFKHVKTNTKRVCHSRYFQAVNQASIILPRQIFDLESRPSPAFSRWYVGKQETFVNLCHINVPKNNPPTFKNYNSGSILTKYNNRVTDQPLSKHHTVT